MHDKARRFLLLANDGSFFNPRKNLWASDKNGYIARSDDGIAISILAK